MATSQQPKITAFESINFPKMAFVKQRLFSSEIENLQDSLLSSIASLSVLNRVKPGDTVAVAVGSRGIDKIDRVVYSCLNFLKEKGLRPYIVPAMGSHGGATPQGQQDVLAKLGMTESTMGVPVLSDLDVAHLSTLPNGLRIFFSQKALEADHIIVINRVKPHTKFKAEIESGLCKMLTIGLGKVRGAAEFHGKAIQHGFVIIEEAAAVILNQCRVLFGIALMEDGYGKLAHVEAVEAESFIRRDKSILREAVSHAARIPFDFLDILIIDFIGKEISGIGMDSNVTGRHRDVVGDFFSAPHVKRIFVRDLSAESDGNGNGIGLADFTTRRLVDALDMEKTYLNAITAISPEKAAIPMYFDNDLNTLIVCAKSIGPGSMESARIVRIRNTASLGYLQVSEALALEIQSNPTLSQISPWEPIRFDDKGNLLDFIQDMRS